MTDTPVDSQASWFLIYPPVHKQDACQRSQTPATVNNDNKCNCQAHELILWQDPPTIQPSGWELQSGDTALLVICYNRGRSLVSSDPTDHFQLMPRPQEASHHQCTSVCVCVWVRKCSRAGGSCLSIFRPDWSEWVVILLLSWNSPSVFFFEFTAWSQKRHTRRARDVTSCQVCCLFTCQGCAVKITNSKKRTLSFTFIPNQL